MKKALLPLITLLCCEITYAASPLTLFKEVDGRTNWQHLANWTSGTLIILLTVTAIILLFSQRKAKRANKALEEIRAVLEQRVLERTATLDDAISLLKNSNQKLEGEINEHKTTTSRLRLSEAYIKDILESMPLMLVGLNEHMVVTQWNREAEKISGVRSADALGKKLWDAYPTITVHPDQVSTVLKDHKPLTIKHSQRGQCYYDITIYPLHEQVETGLVILMDDVTQRIIAENMLIQRDKMSSMGELASSMAHDIDKPLQGMLADIDKVRTTLSSQGSDELRDILQDAAERGKQASGVINNLLEFARSQGESKRPVQITEVVEHTLALAEDVLSEPDGLKFRDIRIERQYEANLPTIPCNVPELQQVFFSLFRHAFQALQHVDRPHFEPTIRIEVMECYDALWLKVQHNGRGLTSAEQQYIFEPFFSKAQDGDQDDSSKRLSFSYFIITEHHDGQMAVTSDVNVGTTFHLQLQLVR